jgi:hypothetical protein
LAKNFSKIIRKTNNKYIRIFYAKKLLQKHNFLAKSYAQKFWRNFGKKASENLAKTF